MRRSIEVSSTWAKTSRSRDWPQADHSEIVPASCPGVSSGQRKWPRIMTAEVTATGRGLHNTISGVLAPVSGRALGLRLRSGRGLLPTGFDFFELWRWRWVRLAIPNYCRAAYSGGSPTVAIGRPVGARLVVVVVISIIVPASHTTLQTT